MAAIWGTRQNVPGQRLSDARMDISLSILGKQFHFHCEGARSATPRFRFTLGTPPIHSDIEVIGNSA